MQPLGTVTSTFEVFYHVLYEEGDEEDLTNHDLLKAIHLNKIQYVNTGSRVVIKRGSELCKATVYKGGWMDDGEEILVHYGGNYSDVSRDPSKSSNFACSYPSYFMRLWAARDIFWMEI